MNQIWSNDHLEEAYAAIDALAWDHREDLEDLTNYGSYGKDYYVGKLILSFRCYSDEEFIGLFVDACHDDESMMTGLELSQLSVWVKDLARRIVHARVSDPEVRRQLCQNMSI